MSSNDEYLNDVLTKALQFQQKFYELLPDWSVYKSDEIKYLKQNIGRAIFGSPQSNSDDLNSNNIVGYKTHNTDDDPEIIDIVHYGSDASQVINKITDQICNHGRMPADKTIRCGIIYQIVIDITSSEQCNKNKEKALIALPLFKIQKYNDNSKTSKGKSNGNGNMYSTWYVDIKGRVYKGWENYMTTNDLPECIIVYPKDGFYQPDPRHNIGPDHSYVWVIAQNSYACSQRAKVLSAVNTTVNVVGTGAAIGLGVASFVTPVGPIVATAGLVTTTASGLWTIGKCSSELYDRSVHEESISPLNRNALSSWLGIAGSVAGIGVSGGNAMLRKAAATGTRVGSIAKTAYNVTLIGSVSINLIGLGYQGYNMYEMYKEKGIVRMEDLMYFGTHLLFFSSSIMNFKFANDIIEATQGQVLREYEATLRSDNLRKRYNLVKDNAATNYKMDKIERNAEIIRYINKFDINYVSNMQLISNNLPSSSNVLMVQQYKLKLNGITLLDPLLFVVDFAKSYLHQTKEHKDESDPSFTSQGRILMKIIENLLGDLYTSKDCPSNKNLAVPNFRKLIQDLQNVKCSKNILPFLFNIALNLVTASNNHAYLVEGCRFMWDYVKENMREAGLDICSGSQHLQNIFGALWEAMDSMINRFVNAFHHYINLKKKQKNY